jgi:hypothetical protein
MYDIDQLNKDLSTIVSRLGNRVQHGFYTVGVYEDDVIKIVDTYIDPAGPEVYLKQKSNLDVRLGKPFNTDCWAGSRILSLAVQLGDV